MARHTGGGEPAPRRSSSVSATARNNMTLDARRRTTRRTGGRARRRSARTTRRPWNAAQGSHAFPDLALVRHAGNPEPAVAGQLLPPQQGKHHERLQSNAWVRRRLVSATVN